MECLLAKRPSQQRVASNAFDPQTNTSVVSVAWSPNVTSHDSGVYSLQFSNVELYRGPSLNYTLPRIKTDSMYAERISLFQPLSDYQTTGTSTQSAWLVFSANRSARFLSTLSRGH